MSALHSRKQPVLKAFVGRSFAEEDKALWLDLREILEPMKQLGFEFEDAKQAQPRPISEKIKELIEANEIYIGILSRRYPILRLDTITLMDRFNLALSPASACKDWTTSEWVIEEVGYALGRGRKTILLIEQGVQFPATDLDADTQWLPFEHKNIMSCQTALTEMIHNLLSSRLTTIEPAQSSVATAAPVSQEVKEPTPDKEPSPSTSDQVQQLLKLSDEGDFSGSDRLLEALLAKEPDPEARIFIEGYVYRERAKKGHATSFEKLQKHHSEHKNSYFALVHLVSCMQSFGQLREAADLLLSSIDMIDKDDRTAIASRTATALIKDKRPIEALTVLRQLLPTFLADPGDHQLAFKRLADVADALKHNELKICALEQAVALNPADHDTRHLLAWLYSDMNKHKPSAFHYKVLVDNGQRPSAINNLGVVYSDLGLKASEITCYIDASPDYLLAQANLAQAYLERGFLDEAHKRAIAVITTADNEDQAASRARYVLQGIESLRDSEKEKISVLDSDTRDERLYRIEYAHAAFNNPVTFTRQFETVHGTLNISVSENKIDGIGSYKRARSGLGALMLGPSQTTTEWHHELKLTGEMLGLSGTFKLTLTTTVPGNQFITPRVTEIEGLLIVSQNLAAMKLLEFGDPPRVTTALSVQ